MGMQKLLLIRHAQPEITPGTPARQWPLSPAGRESAYQLARCIALEYRPAALLTSPEDKARETASIIGSFLDLPVAIIPDLHEHKREHTSWLSPETWEATLTAFFSRPTELILGEETAQQALRRFQAAIESILAAHPSGDLAIVTHGTVLTLFVAHHNPQIDALAFWHALKLPELVGLELPGFKMRAI
jgi:2,3-bisphosphoglycerate-dependent phosphoglycerate mutase